MTLKDFKINPQELVGKTVIYERGQTYSSVLKSLIKIERANKNGFYLVGMPNVAFGFDDGEQKGIKGKSNMATVSNCKLVTDEEAKQLREQWKRSREERELRVKMIEKIKTMTLEQLQKIELL